MREIEEFSEIVNSITQLIEATKNGKALWNKVHKFKIKGTYEHDIITGSIKEVYGCEVDNGLLFYVGSYIKINYLDDDIEYESKNYYLSKADKEGTLLTYEDSELNREIEDYSNEIYRLMRLIKLTMLNNSAKSERLFD